METVISREYFLFYTGHITNYLLTCSLPKSHRLAPARVFFCTHLPGPYCDNLGPKPLCSVSKSLVSRKYIFNCIYKIFICLHSNWPFGQPPVGWDFNLCLQCKIPRHQETTLIISCQASILTK